MPRITDENANVLAFLDTIAYAEIGAQMLANPKTEDGYKVLVGSLPNHLLLFDSYAAHPQVLNHALNSTAAGRYQIIRKTFEGCAKNLGLTDFSPVSQDKAAVRLLKLCGAYDALVAGDIRSAMAAAKREWASMPGAGAKLPDGSPQPEKKADELIAYYLKCGGQLTAKAAPKPAVPIAAAEPWWVALLKSLFWRK